MGRVLVLQLLAMTPAAGSWCTCLMLDSKQGPQELSTQPVGHQEQQPRVGAGKQSPRCLQFPQSRAPLSHQHLAGTAMDPALLTAFPSQGHWLPGGLPPPVTGGDSQNHCSGFLRSHIIRIWTEPIVCTWVCTH